MEQEGSGRKEKHYAFFQNVKCEYFPCHRTEDPSGFNCLFCYCPLYSLGRQCGGNFRYTERGFKDCSGCMIPHIPANYEGITRRYSEIMEVVRREDLRTQEGMPSGSGECGKMLNTVSETGSSRHGSGPQAGRKSDGSTQDSRTQAGRTDGSLSLDGPGKPARARVIMIQGTMSNAGKSLLTAGLCRIFRQDGYRAAPFKSQNMALNSFVTPEGLEIGRAQAMQAEAAGVLPDVRMNPVLLKPSSDMGSQVIVRGKAVDHMDARSYFSYRKSLFPVILESFRSLASEYDIIVIEGAGSPAEINLKKDDIVNMGLAKAVGAPVLLAGDIDRGGIFAQLLGTQMLLEPEERALLKGFIVNKFRGDRSLFDRGVRMLEEKGGIPVVGVVPWMQLDLDDEDSLSPLLEHTDRPPAGKPVEIAVIRLPHISNFTDFNVFSRIPEADLRYVSRPGALGDPDMVVLPGTKSTVSDLEWMRQSGMADAVDALRHKGRVVFGICGGFQMLGRRIVDPEGAETGTAGSAVTGLGFLNAETVFSPEKRLARVRGRISALPGTLAGLEGMSVEGYEIHMGRTIPTAKGSTFAARFPEEPSSSENPGKPSGSENPGKPSGSENPGKPSGSENPGKPSGSENPEGPSCREKTGSQGLSLSVRDDVPQAQKKGSCAFSLIEDLRTGETQYDGLSLGNVYGTYVHGIFDAGDIAKRIVAILAGQKGMSAAADCVGPAGVDPVGTDGYKEAQYDALAAALRESLDMEMIYRILEEGAGKE